jgi:hypothetical protein
MMRNSPYEDTFDSVCLQMERAFSFLERLAGCSWQVSDGEFFIVSALTSTRYALGYQDHAKACLAAHHVLVRIGRFRQGKSFDHWAYVRLHAEFQRVFGIRRGA